MMDVACWKASLDGINATDIIYLMPLLRFYLKIKIFTVVSNGCVDGVNFQKEFSGQLLSINFLNEGNLPKYKSSAILTFDTSESSLIKLLRLGPESLLVYSTGSFPLDFLKNVAIPYTTKLYFITIKEVGKCFRVYHPVLEVKPKICLNAILENNQKTWIPNPDKTCSKQALYDMKEVQLKIAAISAPGTPTYKKDEAVADVFWNITREYLKFKLKYIVREVEGSTIVKIGYLYPLLLSGKVDGIAVVAIANSERARIMDFALFGLDAKYNFVIRKPEFEEQSWMTVVKPFTYEVWICYYLMIILMSVVLWLTTNLTQKIETDFGSCNLMITAFMCGQGSSSIPTKASPRIICFIALIFSFFTYQFYTSNFYSLLSTRVVTLPFDTLEEFMAKKTHSLFIYSDTSLYTDMRNGNSALLKEIWDKFLKNNPDNIINKNNTEFAFKSVCDGKGTILALPIVYFFPTKLCELTKIEPGYFPSALALALKKGFPFLKQFQIALLRALENGFIRKFQKDKLLISDVISQNVVLEPVSLKQISLPVVVFAVSAIFSVLILILEIIYYYRGNFRTCKSRMRGYKIKSK